jgi:TonB family protein
MNISSSFRLMAVLSQIMLAWSIPAFCGEIHDAVRVGDLVKAEALLKENPDLVHCKDNLGWTPLHWAALWDRKDSAELLLAHGADVNARDNSGETSLHLAAGSGHKGTAELLLANKADVNAKNKDGWTPLHTAAANGHKGTAELLLANNADVNAKDKDGNTPLHWAAKCVYKEVAELLIAKGGEVNAKNNKSATPLDIALRKNRDATAELLRQHGGINGEVTDWPPEIYHMPASYYTEEARKAGIKGTVILQGILSADGTFDKLSVIKGLGFGLDEAAIRTVATEWRFKPAIKNGVPVNWSTTIEMSFRMK